MQRARKLRFGLEEKALVMTRAVLESEDLEWWLDGVGRRAIADGRIMGGS